MLTLLRVALASITGSAAMLADAYHSISDLSLSVVFLGCMLFRFRQEKSGCQNKVDKAIKVESIVVILASLFILYLPFQVVSDLRSLSSDNISNIWIGILGVVCVIACVFFMARLKVHVGRQTDSISLEADGYHSMVDLFTSLMVLISLIGLMVGINLDDFVAILIALLIGISGVELLISGIRSLMKGREFDQLSIWELVLHGLKKIPSDRLISKVSISIWQLVTSHKRTLLLCIVAGYLGTGLTQVPLGFTGVRQVLSKTTTDHLQPGLHYALPKPFGEIILVSHGDVRSLTVGSSRSSYTRSNGQNLWFEIVSSRSNRDNTDYIQTGDENLIFLQLTVQYRFDNQAAIIHDYQNLDELLGATAENALWQQVAVTTYDTLLESSHRTFADAVSQQIESEMDRLGIPTRIVGVTVHSIQPPASLVAVYRDVLNAHQESQDMVNQEVGQRLHSLPVTRAEIITDLAEIESSAIEQVLKAEGEINRFSQLASVWQESPAAFQFEKQKNTWISGLSEQELVIADPRFDKHDYRVWGSPLMLPAEPIRIDVAR